MTGKPHFSTKHFDDIDASSEARNYFKPVLEDVARFIEFGTAEVLDVGCGTGSFMVPLVQWGSALYGVDGPTPVAGRALDRGYREVRVVDDLSRDPLPYDGGRFDIAVCKDVFEHLIDPEFALDEIGRVLKEGGRLLLHVPNHFALRSRLKFVFTNDIDTCGFFPGASRWSFPHLRFYEYRDFVATLNRHGFAVEADLSWHFHAVPLIGGIRLLRPIVMTLAARFPNQFAGGFSLLLRKRRIQPVGGVVG